MGNSQSRDSENESEKLIYNYHERVLQDAQQLCNVNGGGYESDDQYFSAEEGDESDRSVTPQRTRPESSSGEDFSDDSASDDDRDRNDTGAIDVSQASGAVHVGQASGTVNRASSSLMNDSQRFLSPRNKRLLMVKKSPGQNTSSSFLEHDSIGPELDRSRWDASAINSSTRTTRHSSQISNIGSGSGSRQTRFSTSPFIPINSPPNSQNVSLRSSMGSTSSIKRKADRSRNVNSEEESGLSPKRRHVLRLSPNKRRLGMLNDSESDCDDNNDRVATKKKPRQNLSVETSEPLGSSGVSQTESASLKRNMKGDSDKDSATEATGSPKKSKFSLGFRKLKVVGEKRSLEHNDSSKGDEHSNDSQIKSFKAGNDVHSEISNAASEKPVVFIRRLHGSAFQPLNEGSNNVVTSHQESERVCQPAARTMKMGNDAIRNSQGKVLPVRKSHHNQTSQSSSCTDLPESSTSSPPSQKSQSETTLITNNTRSLRLRKHGDVNLGSVSNTNNSKSISNSPPHNVGDTDEKLSPFHNVVLTPPSSMANNSTGSLSLKRAAGDSSYAEASECYTNTKEYVDEIAMETDESQSGMDSMETQPYTPRQFATGKRNLTTAERFKNFFTEGSLKSNFKTLFSKKKAKGKSESHPNTPSNQTAWSLYSSPSSSLYGQSPFQNQPSSVFQSTSSPIDAVGSSSVNFSHNLSNVSGTSPLPVHLSGGSSLRQSTSASRLTTRKKEPMRKSTSACQIATRTSPRLRRSRESGGSNTVSFVDLTTGSQNSSGSQNSLEEVVLLPQTSEFQVLHFRLSQTLEISLAMGDIAEELSSGIVNWTDGALTHNATECSRRICAKAGALMRAGCNSYIENKDGALEAPDVLTTPAGGRFPRNVKALLHVVSPSVTNLSRLGPCLLEVNVNCLRFASERLSLDSLSMPLIGEGELPTQICAEAFIDAVLIFITEKAPPTQTPLLSPSLSSSSASLPEVLSSIHLVTADANVTDQAAETIQARIDRVKTNDLSSVVADIRCHYYGNRDSSVGMDGVVDEAGVSDRAKSGRPLVKRPRL